MSVVAAIQSILGSTVGSAFKDIVGSFKADPTKALEIQGQLAQVQLELQAKLIDQVSSQIDVNKVEAANASVFVSGWRPWIGWVCGIAIFTQYVGGPFVTWFAALAHHPVAFPTLDLNALWPLVLGMLGLGTMRTYEKVQGAPGAAKLK